MGQQTSRRWDLEARRPLLALLLQQILDDRVKLVTLMGKAGTGKTLLAKAAALIELAAASPAMSSNAPPPTAITT